MTKEEFEEIIKPLYLLNGKDCQFIRTALLSNFDKWSETKQCNIVNVVGRSERLVCDRCNENEKQEANDPYCIDCKIEIEAN